MKTRTGDFESVLGPAMRRIHPYLRVSVRIVEDLQPDPSGKFRKVVSLVEREAAES